MATNFTRSRSGSDVSAGEIDEAIGEVEPRKLTVEEAVRASPVGYQAL